MRYFRNNDKSTLRSGAAIGERHVRIEISDFVMRTFVLISKSTLRSTAHA